MESDPLKVCNNSYIPTATEYYSALGGFSTTILILGGLVTVGLFFLFVEQVVYTSQTAHYGVRRHIYWITSVFPVMTTMSLVALFLPRAHNVCQNVKMVYMSIGISHFTDLTMVMFGGEEMLVDRGCDDTFNLQQSPLCCCCRCLPRPPVTKYSLRLVVLLTDQLPFAQAIYYIIVSILLSADNITLGNVEPSGAFLWLSLFKLTSVLFGIYGFMILSNFSRGYLDNFSYRRKSRCINLLLLITNLQSMIMNIMTNYGAFPCNNSYLSPSVYKQTVDNSLYMIEMMILGPYSFWQYHDQGFSTPITALPFYRNRSDSTKDNISTTGTISTTVSSVEELSDTSDDEHSGDGNNSNINKDSTKDKIAEIDIEAAKENTATAQADRTNIIIRGSRSRSSKRNNTGDSTRDSIRDSIRDSTNDSSRRGKKHTATATKNSIPENGTTSRKNSNREDSTLKNSRRTSKCKAQRTASDAGHNTRESNGNISTNNIKETSASSDSSSISASSAIQAPISMLDELNTEFVEMQEDQTEC